MRPRLTAAFAVGLLVSVALGQEGPTVHTSREDGRWLPLPKGDDAFGFVVFGDRTGGPASGIEILKQAVRDTNLLDPDLVMTVGDLIQGYNQTEEWLAQMREFKGVMKGLSMPWYPVAGNHDIYWRGPNKPPEEHEKNYEEHFGPLWYSFEHKQCSFVVLYSDEANPETGERDFNKPANQRMSPEQLAWLEAALRKAKEARHVFVFLHHPRWLGRKYGDDWNRVHEMLARAGNVSAVFAGHIHRMRYDGVRDGIEYFTLGTTGGSMRTEVPGAGYLHHFNVVTVRGDKLSVATIPVGKVLDPREITGEVSEDVAMLYNARFAQATDLQLRDDGSVEQKIDVSITNPCRRPVALTVTPECTDRRWRFEPDHLHPELEPQEKRTMTFTVVRDAGPFDANFAMPAWRVGRDYLADGMRITLPELSVAMTSAPPAFDVARSPGPDSVLALDGRGACLQVNDRHLDLPDGPFSVEAWMYARELGGRRALLCKTENSEFGLFVSDGKPTFSVHLSGSYANASATEVVLRTGTWHHVAGVFDGTEIRLYVDGMLVAGREAVGMRTGNDHPLYIGADTDNRGRPVSFFDGWIDDVRISVGVRYEGERFEPPSTLETDGSTLLLLPMDGERGSWMIDTSGQGKHPERVGGAATTLEPKRGVAGTTR